MLRFIFTLSVVLVFTSSAQAIEKRDALLLDYYEPLDAWDPMTPSELEQEVYRLQMRHYQRSLWFGEVIDRLQSAGVPSELLRDALFDPKKWEGDEGEIKPAVVATSVLEKTIADHEDELKGYQNKVAIGAIIVFFVISLWIKIRR